MYKGVTGSTGYEVVEVMWRREERNEKFEVSQNKLKSEPNFG
jgi:hypothetical protein